MCGIAGVYGYTGDTDSLRQRLSVMNRVMIPRGPDEEGIHIEPGMRAGLCVRRLSIMDLEHGSQPLFNEDHSVAVVCNGEIYNHRQLRRELEQKGHQLHSHSDCEVLAHLYEEEGMDFLKRLNGMFALAVLDRRRKCLLLARDPVGMKHLYWSSTEQGIVFASEARALFASGFATPQPDWDALGTYFSIGYVPSPRTAFQGLQRLRPGSYMLITDKGIQEDRYWIPRYQQPEGNRSEQDYSEELKDLLGKAVGTHLDADVPAGLFLSGGWDSSLVSLYASRQSDRPLRSYSLVFPDDPDADESRYFRQVSRQAGTLSHEIEVRDTDVLNAFSRTLLALEEPIFTSPTPLHYLLSQVAGSDLKVVLGGEGSDELFAGYDWLQNSPLHRLRRILPHQLFPAALSGAMSPTWSRALRFLAAPDDEQAHRELLAWPVSRQVASFLHPDISVGIGCKPRTVQITDETRNSFRDALDLKLSVELTGRLADGILFSGEKISMAHSLEVRLPFLDLEVIEFAHRLPSRFKIRDGQRKAVLSSLARELPNDVAMRKKQGLHVPSRIYGSKALLDAYSETVLETSLSSGLFDHGRLEPWVRKLASGPNHSAAQLRPLFYFCLWWNLFIDASAPEYDNQGKNQVQDHQHGATATV
jgi:asparagine synthase (glutamine-hydrolysing)